MTSVEIDIFCTLMMAHVWNNSSIRAISVYHCIINLFIYSSHDAKKLVANRVLQVQQQFLWENLSTYLNFLA